MNICKYKIIPRICRGVASSLLTNLKAFRISWASSIPSKKVLWVCPELTLPLHLRSALPALSSVTSGDIGVLGWIGFLLWILLVQTHPGLYQVLPVIKAQQKYEGSSEISAFPKAVLQTLRKCLCCPLHASVSLTIRKINLILREALRIILLLFLSVWHFGESIHGDFGKHACLSYFYWTYECILSSTCCQNQ